MNCQQIELMLSTFLDGELSASDQEEVEHHLQNCSECRHELAALRQMDIQLREQFRNVDMQSRAVIDSVQAEIEASAPVAPNGRRTSVVVGVARYGLAALAGFVLAVLLTSNGRTLFRLRPHQASSGAHDSKAGRDTDRPQSTQGKSISEVEQHAAVVELPEFVARVTHTTGGLSYKAPGDSEWRVIDNQALPSLACPSNTQLKTLNGGLAELETADGCRIRINENTEIALRATDNVELRTGDLWCRTPADRKLQVITPPQSDTAASTPGPTSTAPNRQPADVSSTWTVACQADSTCLTSRPSLDGLRVLAAAGTVNVRTTTQSQDVTSGSGVEYIGGELRPQQAYASIVDAERWVQPLMTLEGHQSPEISRRVEALLTHMGRAKLSHLYERDIRSLGEFSSRPLLSFLKGNTLPDDDALREKAARILADTAPVWMIPELLELMETAGPDVRYPLANGLQRLTGIPHDLTRQQWEQQADLRSVALSRWQQWWSVNRFTCQLPPRGTPHGDSADGKSPARNTVPQQRSPVEGGTPPPIQKARVPSPRP